MKKITTLLRQHLEQTVTTLATCWNIKLLNGREIGFTEHDVALELDGVKYAPSGSINCSAIENTCGLQADNLQIKVAIGDCIQQKDIISGHYDGAAIEIFMLNFMDLSLGKITLFCGDISGIKLSDGYFTAELKSYSDQLNNTVGEVYSPLCRADFCDQRCGLNAEDFARKGSITMVLNEISFSDKNLNEEDGFFNYGSVQMMSGANSGLKFNVKENHAGVLMLTLPPPHPLSAGDEYRIIAGCDKKFESCRDRFANAINFRGEPNIPGYDGLV